MKEGTGIKNEYLPKTPEEFKKAFKKVRHKAEVPLYCMAVLLTVFIALFLIISGIGFKGMGSTQLEARFLAGGVEASTASMLAQVLGLIGSGVVIFVIVFFAGILIYGYYYNYAKVLAYSIKVTPENFPEIYELTQQYAGILGLKKVPDVYIEQKNGEINAFACWVIGRNIIQLNAEVVDIAVMENKDMEPVKFILGHEFGHVYLKHVHILYKLGCLAWERIPILGSLLKRSREYSCDRVGQLLAGSDVAKKGMALLTCGRHLYAHVDAEDYVQNIVKKRNFAEKISLFIYHIFQSHPINHYRMAAILDPKKKSGKLL